MINPPLPPTIPKPHITDIGMQPQMFSPPATKETPTNMASPLLPSKVNGNLNAHVMMKLLFQSSRYSSMVSLTSSTTNHSRKTTCSMKTDKSDVTCV